MPRHEFQEIFLAHMHTWMSRIFREVDEFLQDQNLRYPQYIFTGGAVMTEGFLEWVQENFKRDGRLGTSRGIDAPLELIRNPSLAPAFGMFRWIMTHGREYKTLLSPRSLVEKSVMTARNWISTYF